MERRKRDSLGSYLLSSPRLAVGVGVAGSGVGRQGLMMSMDELTKLEGRRARVSRHLFDGGGGRWFHP